MKIGEIRKNTSKAIEQNRIFAAKWEANWEATSTIKLSGNASIKIHSEEISIYNSIMRGTTQFPFSDFGDVPLTDNQATELRDKLCELYGLPEVKK